MRRRYEFRDYPPNEQEQDAYNQSMKIVREACINGGVLVYIEQLYRNDKMQSVSRQIEVVGYRHTPLIGRKKVKLISGEERQRTESSLRKILEADPVIGKIPTTFSFQHN